MAQRVWPGVGFVCWLLLQTGAGRACADEDARRPCFRAAEHSRLIELRQGIDVPPKRVAFTYDNVGDAPLEVGVKSVSCGCTKGVVRTPITAPGDKGCVEFELGEGKFKNGGVVYMILQTNDPEQREVQLQLEVRWIPQLVVRPARAVAFGRVTLGQEAFARVSVVQNFGDTPLEVDIASVTGNCLEVGLGEDKTDGLRAFSCSIRIVAVPPAGPFQETVTLTTNLEGHREMPISVSGVVVGDLEVEPWQIAFNRVPVGACARRRIQLLPGSDGVCRFATAYTDVSRLKLGWDVKSVPPLLTITYGPEEKPGAIQGSIFLVSKSGQETRVPVVGCVVPRICPVLDEAPRCE